MDVAIFDTEVSLSGQLLVLAYVLRLSAAKSILNEEGFFI